jgi:hypothetical protein
MDANMASIFGPQPRIFPALAHLIPSPPMATAEKVTPSRLRSRTMTITVRHHSIRRGSKIGWGSPLILPIAWSYAHLRSARSEMLREWLAALSIEKECLSSE